jgi:hypothetical protein
VNTKVVYYGTQTSTRVEIWGPYGADEVPAHTPTLAALSDAGIPIHRVLATSYADAVHRLSQEPS